jgi:hypothetical protein
MAEILAGTPACMITVRMGNNGLAYRLPGIDIKLSLGTVKTFIGKFYQGHAVLGFLVMSMKTGGMYR